MSALTQVAEFYETLLETVVFCLVWLSLSRYIFKNIISKTALHVFPPNRAFLAGLQNLLRILCQDGYKDTSTRMKMYAAAQQTQERYHSGRKIGKMTIWYMLMRRALIFMMGESLLSQQSVIQKVSRMWTFLWMIDQRFLWPLLTQRRQVQNNLKLTSYLTKGHLCGSIRHCEESVNKIEQSKSI